MASQILTTVNELQEKITFSALKVLPPNLVCQGDVLQA